MNQPDSATIDVEIFGSRYHLRAGEDAEYLRELAGFVDRKMREVAERTSSRDVAKLAILTALNVSDELFQCRKGQEGEWDRVRERVAELADQLTGALRE